MRASTERPAKRSGEEILQRLEPLVRRTAMRVGRIAPTGVTVSDLVDAGWVGVRDARREALHDARYAEQRVKSAMFDYLKSRDPHAVELRRISRRIAETIGRETRALGRTPDEHELAHALGVAVFVYRSMLIAVADGGMARLEVVDFDQEAEVETARDARRDGPIEGSLEDALESLPERLTEPIALHFQEGCSHAEIAAILGLTPRRAKELLAEGMHFLRAAIGRT